jgi:RNA polymerase sigma-70 factor (ECF subfamily)
MWLVAAVIARSDVSTRETDSPGVDRTLIARMAQGDGDALAELYDRHARPVYSLAVRILRDARDAEDVVQEVFAQAWRQASRYTASRGAVIAWLLTLARSRAIDRLRARRARPEGASDDAAGIALVDASPPIEHQLVSAEQVARVRAAVDDLPLLQRIAIELAYFEGLSHVEIADRLEQPLGTVKTRIRLAMGKLREMLGGAV